MPECRASERARIGVVLSAAAQTSVCFRAVRAITRGGCQAARCIPSPPDLRDGIEPNESLEAVRPHESHDRSSSENARTVWDHATPAKHAPRSTRATSRTNDVDLAHFPRIASQKSGEIRCWATASPLPLHAIGTRSCRASVTRAGRSSY
jgi:hypothetical protein